MVDVSIDRLTIRVPGLALADGTRLGNLVGERLAVAALGPNAGSLERVRISIQPRTGESLDALAQRIVDQMLVAMHGGAG